MMQKVKFQQISAVARGNHLYLFALDEGGQLWQLVIGSGQWSMIEHPQKKVPEPKVTKL